MRPALTEGVGLPETARRLSISIKTPANWIRAAKTGKLKDVARHRKPLMELEAGLAQMKRELAEVRMERDLLRKFATYFAKESWWVRRD
ncbi:transposase [Burkholderia mayonis]|uniref:Transposase n=1 Tax=Burkholderia mayonis TaxID=1385591 RepID=A0A1B4FQ54_9BURK|nr:transposase [Burkholderia mayonis]KVE39137.1 transposase [Burkholderia sp. BDU5]KVE45640.1 transposase [Burkholderia mayonis]